MTQALHATVEAVWRRTQKLHLTAGLFAFFRWGGGLFLLFLAVDSLLHLPAWLRGLLLVAWFGFALYKGWQHGWRHCRRFNPTHTALKIEDHFGNLDSLLVTALQFQKDATSNGSDSLKALTCRRAEETISPLPVKRSVKFGALKRPVLWLLLVAGIIGSLAAINRAHLGAGFSRFFTPWRAVSYPTDTQIHLAKGDLVVKEGEGLNIEATLSGVIPDQATLALRTGDGEPRRHVLEVVENACAYPIKSTHRSFEYQVQAGDAESPWHQVTVISAPRIVNVKNTVRYPKYTRKPDGTLETLTFTVPEGSKLVWNLSVDRPIRNGQFICEGEAPVPLDISEDGTVVRATHPASSSRAYRFTWVEKEHGYEFESPRHFIQVLPDRPPTVDLARPDRNLMATLQRDLPLKVGARDDHGIADADILFRLNQLENERLPFPLKHEPDDGWYDYDWDYHESLPDLKVGDKISFALEVADRYPGPEGGYKTRSDWRTITFLSEEDYLAHVAKIRQRLLSQLRGLYRQERQAYSVVDALDRQDDNFRQSCTLEGMRQDIIAERLRHIAEEIAGLVDDLLANKVADESRKAELEELIGTLRDISETHVQLASGALRNLSDPSNKEAAGRDNALLHINRASREIASIVLRLGVSFSSEVFSRELHAAIHDQTILRLEGMDLAPGNSAAAKPLSDRQNNLGNWITRLLDEMTRNQDFENRPLVSIRLSRVVSSLQERAVDERMTQAGTLLAAGKTTEAAALQETILSDLSQAHYRVQPSSEAMDLIRARDLLQTTGNMQQEIRDLKLDKAEAIAARQQSLIRTLRPLVIPHIPPAHTMIVDPLPTTAPDIEGMVTDLREAIGSARTDNELAAAQDRLQALSQVVERRLSEKMQFGRLYKMYMTAIGRNATIENLHVRQLGILEKVEDAAAEEEDCANLATSQESLRGELLAVRREIEKNQRTARVPSKFELAVMDAFDRAAERMEQAAIDIKKNDALTVIEVQEEVLTALEDATDITTQEADSLGGLVLMMVAAGNMELPRGHLADIVAVQNFLMQTTRNTPPESAASLVPPQKRVSLGVYAVSSTLDTESQTVNLEQAFTFAGSALGAAVLRLETNDPAGAVTHQQMAMNLIGNIGEQLEAFEIRNAYLAEVMEYVQQRVADNVEISTLLKQLTEEVDFEEERPLREFVARQKSLHDKANAYGSILKTGTGIDHYLEASIHLEKAIKLMDSEVNRLKAVREMEIAFAALDKDRGILLDKLVRLGLIPGILEIDASDAVQSLLEVIALAARQNRLTRELWRADESEKMDRAEDQLDFQEEVQDLVNLTREHQAIVEAQAHMEKAVASIQESKWNDAYKHQRETGNALLQYVLETCHQVPLPNSFSRKKPKSPITSKGNPQLLQTTEDLQIFAKMAVEGELPEDKRSEWDVLGSRDRAALNENFARELPLEYRELLKDYYERLAQ